MNIHEILQKSIQARAILEDVKSDSNKFASANNKLASSAELLTKINKLALTLKELETEFVSGEFDYYRVISELLVDVQQQASFFEPYQAIPHVVAIRDKLQAIENELRRQIQWSFRELGQLLPSLDNSEVPPEPSISIDSLSQVHLVIDALGEDFRKDLVERFAQLQLIPYEKLFAQGTKVSGLDNLDRRYEWFKRLLKAVDDRVSSLFPTSWMVPFYLFLEFSRRTRKHLVDLLKDLEENIMGDKTTHVQTMLKALKSIISFETEMKSIFQMYTSVLGYEVKLEYSDSITQAFDSYLGPYVAFEREQLEKLMTTIMSNEDKGVVNEDEGPMNPSDPYFSSRKMFEYIKKSLKRCTTYSTGQTYLALSREYRICLHNYSESLKFRCPSPEFSKPGQPLIYNVTPAAEETLIRVIITGDYCIDTVPQLEEVMKKQIQPELIDELDFSGQIDSFNDMVGFVLGILCQVITSRLQTAFKNMRGVNWGVDRDVMGDESKYVKEIIAVFNEHIPRLRRTIPTIYFQSYLMKLVNAFLDTLLATIWKLKRVTQTGAGQLLLDLNGVKEYLLRMPNARMEAGKEPLNISTAYKSHVNSRIAQIQTILKLVCIDDDKIDEMFTLLWPEGKPSDLEAVKGLKGKSNFLDPVGDKLKEGAQKFGSTVIGEKAVSDIKGGLGEIKGNVKGGFGMFKSAFGELKAAFTSDIFEDGKSSTHGSAHGSSTHGHDVNQALRKTPVKAPVPSSGAIPVKPPSTQTSTTSQPASTNGKPHS